MELSLTGVALIERVEGSKNQMYHDQVGLPTIGVGHKLTQSELSSGKILIGGVFFDWKDGLTDGAVKSLLEQDTTFTSETVSNSVKVPLTQPQFDALTSFAFNVGNEAFITSTLLKLLNQGDYADVPTQMRRWIYSKSVVLQDLITRREAEISRWLSAN